MQLQKLALQEQSESGELVSAKVLMSSSRQYLAALHECVLGLKKMAEGGCKVVWGHIDLQDTECRRWRNTHSGENWKLSGSMHVQDIAQPRVVTTKGYISHG